MKWLFMTAAVAFGLIAVMPASATPIAGLSSSPDKMVAPDNQQFVQNDQQGRDRKDKQDAQQGQKPEQVVHPKPGRSGPAVQPGQKQGQPARPTGKPSAPFVQQGQKPAPMAQPKPQPVASRQVVQELGVTSPPQRPATSLAQAG